MNVKFPNHSTFWWFIMKYKLLQLNIYIYITAFCQCVSEFILSQNFASIALIKLKTFSQKYYKIFSTFKLLNMLPMSRFFFYFCLSAQILLELILGFAKLWRTNYAKFEESFRLKKWILLINYTTYKVLIERWKGPAFLFFYWEIFFVKVFLVGSSSPWTLTKTLYNRLIAFDSIWLATNFTWKIFSDTHLIWW